MNRNNVVPFRPASPGAMARRGAPDKRPIPGGALELECPRCEAVLRLDLDPPAAEHEVLCFECDAPIAIARRDLADLG